MVFFPSSTPTAGMQSWIHAGVKLFTRPFSCSCWLHLFHWRVWEQTSSSSHSKASCLHVAQRPLLLPHQVSSNCGGLFASAHVQLQTMASCNLQRIVADPGALVLSRGPLQMHLHTSLFVYTCIHKQTGDNSMMCTCVYTQSLPLLLTNQCSNTLHVSNICNIAHGPVHYLAILPLQMCLTPPQILQSGYI